MKRTVVLISCAIFSLAPAAAQGFGPDYQAILSLENEFGRIAQDVRVSLRGMPNKAGVDYACVDSSFRAALQLYTVLSHYKFSVAIYSAVDELEKTKVALILKPQTTQVADEIRITRERINGTVGTCSKFPLAVGKGTELLEIMRRANEAVKKIQAKL